MTEKELFLALRDVDDRMIADAAPPEKAEQQPCKPRTSGQFNRVFRRIAIAACLILLIGGIFLPHLIALLPGNTHAPMDGEPSKRHSDGDTYKSDLSVGPCFDNPTYSEEGIPGKPSESPRTKQEQKVLDRIEDIGYYPVLIRTDDAEVVATSFAMKKVQVNPEEKRSDDSLSWDIFFEGREMTVSVCLYDPEYKDSDLASYLSDRFSLMQVETLPVYAAKEVRDGIIISSDRDTRLYVPLTDDYYLCCTAGADEDFLLFDLVTWIDFQMNPYRGK